MLKMRTRDSNLGRLHPVAINAIIELAKSPADCAGALLLPEFAPSLNVATESSSTDTEEVSRAKVVLKQAIVALRIEMHVQDELPRISELSEMSCTISSDTAEFEGTVQDLLRLCRCVQFVAVLGVLLNVIFAEKRWSLAMTC